jgi:DNA ligase 1
MYMCLNFRPMLAAALSRPRGSAEELEQNLSNIIFPVLVTPKIDGIRCITMNWPHADADSSVPVCRSLKQVPNDHIRGYLANLESGIDGEIMTYPQRELFEDRDRPSDFHQVQSDVMTVSGMPIFKYHVFDYGIHKYRATPYRDRVEMLRQATLPDFCVKLIPKYCYSIEELYRYFERCLEDGHEGICFRDIWGPYKHGRSTLKQGWLIKWKLFTTSEALIVGFEERMRNENVPQRNELGYQERSSHQENMIPAGDLGALIVQQDVGDGVIDEFKIGTGFTAAQRVDLWSRRSEILNKHVTFKHQPYGRKDSPRTPVFLGIRHSDDMS